MKISKSLITIFIMLFGLIVIAQEYKFIPLNQRLVSDEQLKSMEIMITPNIMLFNEQGKILPFSQIDLLANPEYRPLFYVDSSEKLQSVIFLKRSDNSILIEKNPEAEFTKGERALDFIVTTLDGQHIKLSELRGKVVVLNFWFIKCGPCKLEMPDLNNLVNEFKDESVVFLAITFNKKEIIQQFLESNPFSYTIAPNANDVITMYGVQSYPTSIVINKEGEIVLKELGYRTNIKEVLTNSIKTVL